MRKVLIVVVVFLAASAFAFSPQGRYYGDPIVGITARSLSMGEVGLIGATGAIEGVRNPAQLSALSSGFHIEASGMFPQTIESRSFPIYDGFDGVLADNQYVSTSMGDAQFAIGLSFSMKSEAGTPWTVALVSKPSLDYYYKFKEEIRDRFSTGGLQDRVRGRVEDKTEGARRWSGIAASFPIMQSLSAGVAVGMNSGSIKSKYAFARFLDGDSAGTIEISDEPDNAHMESRIGLTYQMNDRLRFGANYTLRGSWNDKISIDSTSRYYVANNLRTKSSNTSMVINRTYPSSIGAGLEYIPGQMLRSKFNAEFEWTNWKSTDLGVKGLELLNTMDVRLGIEHRILPEVPVRFGYRYSPSPFDKEWAVSYLSAGSGYDSKNWVIDFGVQFGHLSTKGNDPVPDNWFGGTARVDQDKVQDRMFRFTAGLSYHFDTTK